MSAPKVLSRKANGVAVNQPANNAPKAPRTKAPPEGEKVVVRRLPPAMTEEEFITILGDTWKVGNGKINWLSYWPGKVSQHPSKPSQPSRAYLHVKKRDDLLALSEAVRNAEWQDAKGTFNDPALILPPAVEFSIYKKVPSDKKRSDGRQGTIDQDSEFMAFLESLANPDANKTADAADHEETGKGEKPTTTPLIEHLRERAAKAKEAAAAKVAKHSRQDSQGGKGKAIAGSSEEPKRKGKETKSDKTASEKAAGKAVEKPREAVRILSKKAAADAAAEAAKVTASQIRAAAQSSAQSSTPEPPPKSRRAGIAAAARILQRDLGLSPGNAHRKARQEAAKAEGDAKASASSKEPAKEATPVAQEPTPPSTPIEPTPSTSSTPAKAQATPSSRRTRTRNRGAGEDGAKAKGDGKVDGKGDGKADKAAESSSQAPAKPPIILMKKRDDKKELAVSAPSPSPSPAPSASSAAPSGSKSTPAKQQQTPAAKKGGGSSNSNGNGNTAATPAPGARRAFVKHVNISHGVTEPLLREAMQAFGVVTAVEMDRKKGFAYVDFADHDALVKAMAASPVTVAQGTVQVLERKEVAAGGKKSGAAAGSSGRGESSSTAAAPAAVAGPSTEKSAASPATSQSQSQAQEKEKEKHRGGRRRGGRGRGEKESGGKDGGAATGSGKGGADGGAGQQGTGASAASA